MSELPLAVVDELALQFRDNEWERFLDGASLWRDAEENNMVFQGLKAAWDRAHPMSIFVTKARFELGF